MQYARTAEELQSLFKSKLATEIQLNALKELGAATAAAEKNDWEHCFIVLRS